jgi:hypothetical protein
MPEKQTRRRAQRAKVQGKAGSTQAGEYVREEIEHVRGGKHGARSTKQAIAIGLSKARRRPSAARKRATRAALKREGRAAATRTALSRQARTAAAKRSPAERSAAARRAVRTKGPVRRRAAAKKAARTRASRRANA